MRFLAAIIDALVAFVQRNPLFVLAVVILALFAPSLLRGAAAFVLYLFLGLLMLAGVLMLLFRWRIYRMRRDMEEQFGRGFGPRGADPFARRRPGREGDVQVRKTAGAPEKRVSSDVGDYVDFEETKEEKQR